MRIVRLFSLEQVLLSMVLVAGCISASGCGEADKNTQPAAAPQPAAEQEAERAAREKAMQKK